MIQLNIFPPLILTLLSQFSNRREEVKYVASLTVELALFVQNKFSVCSEISVFAFHVMEKTIKVMSRHSGS